MSKHIMLDLETMSSAKDAAIIAIGAVRFDPQAGTLEGQYYQVINLKSAEMAGGRIDSETVMWWLGQSEEARKALLEAVAQPIDAVLKDFSNWVREVPIEGVWGNGSDFDNVILETAYNRIKWTVPWSHRINRCYRTVSSFSSLKRKDFRDPDETSHTAIGDARAQAKHLCAIWKLLGL